jgi:methionyl-tRNA formyltransferase
VEVDAEGFTVACADGRIRVLRVRGEGAKVTGGEFAKTAGLAAGTKLGT